MAGITLAQAEARLAVYLTAESDILTRGQSTAIEGRDLTRANLKEIQAGIELWERRVKNLTRGGIRMSLAAPR